ncbi:MAG: ABC transporter ATP-binding protein [Chloroflexi bacterium]|nr:ABC transporter ATP-binding protein [Chloroflexota bacterium]
MPVSEQERSQHQQSGQPAIVVRDLVKRYSGRVVVAGLSFDVGVGEIFALLGPNGAGKTTTIEVLEGYRRRDGGEVRVLGLDPERDGPALRRRVGLMLQEGGVYPAARPLEMLRLVTALYETADDPARLLALVGLEEVVATPYRRLSGGQKQRLALALALVGQPELVFLDEPTAGLDPEARRLTWAIIRDLRASGVTVVLTTHRLDEAEVLADRIAIVDHGRLVALGDLATLSGATGSTVRVVTAGPLDTALLAALPAARSARLVAPDVALIETAAPALALAEVTAWAVRAGVAIREVRVGGETLEEIYWRLTSAGEPD